MNEIRWLIRRDMEEVLDIEKHSFSHPWTEEEFLTCLRQPNCIGAVYDDGEVLGFMIYELHRGCLNLLNLAVLPRYRRNGIGRALVLRLIGKLDIQRRQKVTTLVRSDNIEARAFFMSLGFRQLGLRKNYYVDCGVQDDAVELAYVLGVSAATASQ